MSLLARTSKSIGLAEDRSTSGHGHGDEVNALLGKGASFEGKLVFEGTVHINGVFTGEIRSSDTLVVGEGAKVHGEVHVGTLIINGEVSGNIRAKHLVEMHPPARVKGTVVTPSLVIDRGVVFEGTTQMESLEAPAPVPPKGKGA